MTRSAPGGRRGRSGQRVRRTRAGRVRLVLGWSVIVIALAVGLVETAGRRVTERIAEDQIRAAGVAGGVDVTIGRSWWQPSIVGVLLFDTLDRVDVRLSDARLYSTQIHEADYVLNDLVLDLSIKERTVKARALGSGSVQVLIDPSVIAQMVGRKASIRDGRLVLEGSDEPVRLRIVGTDLVIDGAAIEALAGGDPVSLPVVDPQILPCTPKVRIVDRFIELSCTGNKLPGVLRTSLGAADPQGSGGTGTPSGEVGPGEEWTHDGESELTPPATLELPPQDPQTQDPQTRNPSSTTAKQTTTSSAVGG